MNRTTAVFPAPARALLEGRLPDWLDVTYFASPAELLEFAPRAEIGWFDMMDVSWYDQALRRAEKLRWLVTVGAGVDFMPLDLLMERGVIITKGTGINAAPIAEYIVMGMLAIAKNYPEVLRMREAREWPVEAPGRRQLSGSRALIIGHGSIGHELERRLRAFDVEVVGVTRSGADGTLKPDEWQARVGEFDWIVLAAPATEETRHIVGAEEIAAMKPEAVLVNVARGTLVDQAALTRALAEKRICAAMLDVTDPEPLPPDDPLWSLDNAHITMHLSGRSQQTMFGLAVERLLRNLDRYARGQAPEPLYDPVRGY